MATDMDRYYLDMKARQEQEMLYRMGMQQQMIQQRYGSSLQAGLGTIKPTEPQPNKKLLLLGDVQ